MSDKLSKKFLASNSVLFLQSKIFGLVTFNLTTLKPSKLHTLRNILASIVYLSIILFYINDSTNQDIHAIIITTDIIITAMGGVYVITAWICAITKGPLLIDFLKTIIDIDRNFETIGVKINYRKHQQRVKCHVLMRFCALIAVIATLIWGVLMTNRNIFLDLGDFIVLFVVNSVVCHESAAIVSMLRTRFVIINALIQNGGKIWPRDNRSTLARFCNIHHKLCSLVVHFNDIFGFVLLLMFFVSFVIIVLSIFYLIAALQSSKITFVGIVDPTIKLSTFVFNVVYICRLFQTTIDELNKTGDFLHRINDDDVIREKEMFSLQIAHDQVEFTAADLFPINHSLIFSFIGGVTTYIIILIQLAESVAN